LPPSEVWKWLEVSRMGENGRSRTSETGIISEMEPP
jgi:hypothetical protein